MQITIRMISFKSKCLEKIQGHLFHFFVYLIGFNLQVKVFASNLKIKGERKKFSKT